MKKFNKVKQQRVQKKRKKKGDVKNFLFSFFLSLLVLNLKLHLIEETSNSTKAIEIFSFHAKSLLPRFFCFISMASLRETELKLKPKKDFFFFHSFKIMMVATFQIKENRFLYLLLYHLEPCYVVIFVDFTFMST